MDPSKVRAEIRSKLLLTVIPVIIAYAAGGMFPMLIGVSEGFSLLGGGVWALIIFMLDYKMITIDNPSGFVKVFRFMLLCLTATITSVIIDNAVFKPDIDQWKVNNPPLKNEVFVRKAECDLEVAQARRECEKSGRLNCGVVCDTNIYGSGQTGAGALSISLQKDVDNAAEELKKIKSKSEGGLLYDFKALKSVIKEDFTAGAFWVFFFILTVALEGIVLMLMHTDSKDYLAKVKEIDDDRQKRREDNRGDIDLKIIEGIEKTYHK